jgi:hypothetical protein
MIYSVQQIKFEMLSYIKEFDSKFFDWYVGISGDPKLAMRSEHGLDLDQDIWLYRQALSFTACLSVQSYFIEILQTDGRIVTSGTHEMDCVYLYKKGARTSP